MTRNHQIECPPVNVLRAMDAASRAYISNACCIPTLRFERVAAQFEVPDQSWGTTILEDLVAEQMTFGYWAANAIPPSSQNYVYTEEMYQRDKAEMEGRTQ